MEKYKNTSKFLSLVLRHKPETIGITLDKNGWADVSELLDKMNDDITLEILEEIVKTNDKKRFAFNDDKTKIRASQGHSIGIDLNISSKIPPDILYHGTAEKFLESIKNSGLNRGSRTHVHLSTDYDTAINVGKRHGKPIVLKIVAKKMNLDGYKFYLSENKVWLTKEVAKEYIKW